METTEPFNSINQQPLVEKTNGDYKNVMVSLGLIISAVIATVIIYAATDAWNFLAGFAVYPVLICLPFLLRYSLGRVVSLNARGGFNWSYLLVFALLGVGLFQPFFTLFAEVWLILFIAIAICIKEIKSANVLTVKVFAEVFMVLSVFVLGINFLVLRSSTQDMLLRYTTEKARIGGSFDACTVSKVVSVITGYDEQDCRYVAANNLGYKNVDPESISDPRKRDEIYLQSASEIGNVALCEKIDDIGTKIKCVYNYYVDNHPNEITFEICSSLQTGKGSCLSKIVERCSDNTCYEKIGACFKLPEPQKSSCFKTRTSLALEMCLAESAERENCFYGAALSTVNPSICDKISNEGTRSFCKRTITERGLR